MESSYEDNITHFDNNFTEYNWDYDWDEPDFYYRMLQFFYISRVVLFTIIAIVGIIGNGLVIWITGFKMKSISAVWFLNLAIADFISCLFLLFYVIEWSFPIFDLSSVILCIIRFFMLSLNMLTSVYFLMVISLDRCVSTMWPLWARIHRKLKPVRIISGIIWVFCLVSGFMYEFYHFWDRTETECLVKRYLVIKEETGHRYITRMIFMFVFPFTIILVSYGVVAFKIKARKRWHTSKRPFKLIIALVLCFFICWFPFHVSSLTPDINTSDRDVWKNVLKDDICLLLAYVNSCLNPIIYVLLTPEVKAKILRNKIESNETRQNYLRDDDDKIPNTTHRSREQSTAL